MFFVFRKNVIIGLLLAILVSGILVISAMPTDITTAGLNPEIIVVDAGHGGMDYLVYRAFVESVKMGINPPIDVYDTASWMCISTLSEKSISLGGMPVEIPDFTNGKWFNRTDIVDFKYSLDYMKNLK